MTTASRATALGTAAAREAARKLAAELDGGDLANLAGREYHGEYVLDFTTKPGAQVENPVTHLTFGYATQVVILDDEGRLERVVAAHDVGRAINPQLCVGQIEGSIHMGLGYALSEDFPCTGGRPDSLLLRDLGILKAKHTPPMDVILVEVPDEHGGYGSKGVGEIGLVPTAGAVAGALHAFDGVHRTRLPMTDAPAAAPSVPKSRAAPPRADDHPRPHPLPRPGPPHAGRGGAGGGDLRSAAEEVVRAGPPATTSPPSTSAGGRRRRSARPPGRTPSSPRTSSWPGSPAAASSS